MIFNNIRKEILNGNSESTIYLIKKVTPLILSNIKKYNLYEQFDDTFQDSVELLLECVRKYKPCMNVPFIGYYEMWLKFYHLTNQYHDKKEILNLDTPILEEGMTIKDTIPSQDIHHLDHIIHDEENKELYKSINNLRPKQKWIIEEHYIHGKSLVQISKETNKNYQGLVKLKARAIKQLQLLFNNS